MNTQTIKWQWSIEDTGLNRDEVLEEPAESFEAAKAAIEAYLAKQPEYAGLLRGVIGRKTLVLREDGEFGWDYDSFREGGDGQWRLWE